MSPTELKEKKETLTEIISSVLTEELDEAIAYEMSREIEVLAKEAVTLFSKDTYSGEDTEDQGLIEYRADMDEFAQE